MSKHSSNKSKFLTHFFKKYLVQNQSQPSSDRDGIANTEYQALVEALQLTESHLSHAQQIANVGSWEYYVKEDKMFLSDAFYDIFGLSKSLKDPKLEEVSALIHPEDYEKTKHILQKDIRKGKIYEREYRIFKGNKKDDIRFIRVHAEAVCKNNKTVKLVGVIRDYTKQKMLEEQIEKTQEQYRHIFNHLDVGIWVREYDTGKLTFISKGAENILETSRDSLYNNPNSWEEMLHPTSRQGVLEAQKSLASGETLYHQYKITTGNGTMKWVYDQAVPWFDDQGKLTNVFGLLADITAEKEMREQLEYFATHDTLTGLPNRRSLYDELDALCENNKQEPFALLYLDLERLSLINDSLGYHIGDEVLKIAAKRILESLPKNSYLARLTSCDFILIVKEYVNKDDLFQFAENVIKGVENPIIVNDFKLHVTLSIGVSFFPEDGGDKLTLIETAHSALYHAKQLGKSNIQLYSFTKDISAYKRYQLEQHMRDAIKDETFELFYQPLVDPKNGTIQGAEALIRWLHEEWGLVSPDEFIPLAEENHLINEISDWVIKKVCAQLRNWKDQGFAIQPISINISPIRFLKKGLVEFVQEQLKHYQIPGKYLVFEITEGSLLQNDKNVLNTLHRLRELGICLSIDDFGTGHASLTYLHDFQADTIKIDKTFIQNISSSNKRDKVIISSILHLAKELDMKVVAEGVEEFDQLEFLRQKECDVIQGYLYSKPVPAEMFTEMMNTGYLKPTKWKTIQMPEDERRSHFRLEFDHHIQGEMTIYEVNQQKVNLGSAPVLVEDISLGGLKILSTLKLPINAGIKFIFHLNLMGEEFELEGTLAWKNEARGDAFYYGIQFRINEVLEDLLVGVINKMTVLQRNNRMIPDTPFINENPYTYLKKHHL
ncbi:EAL domain-containing protein [Oceanobacillus halotolerans]|uniref:EAL domain-containing protein n=1 Tax=Oceanobacillus halotolerans TaxID=2663380 RepID=UPI0013D92C68|nr:EAL domain-containing protein [Oceanobacillus halotolerans]